MRIGLLLEILINEKKVASKAYLMKKFDISDSTMRKLVKDANETGKSKGFQIELLKGEGYYLVVENQQLLTNYLEEEIIEEGYLYNIEQREKMILFYIFQSQKFITIDQISELMNISRATIIRDLKNIEKILNKRGLNLLKKPHYGYMITGDEKKYRKTFSEFVLNSELYLVPTKEFYDYSEKFKEDELKEVLVSSLLINNVKMSDYALENVVNHIKILVYRSESQNFISDVQVYQINEIGVYKNVASEVINWIENNYGIVLPDPERQLLAAHLSGKASVDKIDSNYKNELIKQIELILREIDNEFYTTLSEDKELKNALLLHMFPLLNRLYSNLELDNPLIADTYSRYSNTYLIAFRFGEYIENTYKFRMSIDEVGYLSFHFAAHFERKRINAMGNVKKILLVSANSGGSAQLLRLQLESIFPKAIIVNVSLNELALIEDVSADIIISTEPLNNSIYKSSVIYIKQMLDDIELNKIKNQIILNNNDNQNQQEDSDLLNLFSEKFFYRNPTVDYEELLKIMSEDLTMNNYATTDFSELVLERERRYSTIYKNGVAGPHSLKLSGIKDIISVAVFDKPFEWKEQNVQIVFLINLKQGHLFLHREISKLLLKIIEDNNVLNKLVKAKTFDQFKLELEKVIE